MKLYLVSLMHFIFTLGYGRKWEREEELARKQRESNEEEGVGEEDGGVVVEGGEGEREGDAHESKK